MVKKHGGVLKSLLEGGNLKPVSNVKVPSVAKAAKAKPRKSETSTFGINNEQTIFSPHQYKVLETMMKRVSTTSLTTVGMSEMLAIGEYKEKQKGKKEDISQPPPPPQLLIPKEELKNEDCKVKIESAISAGSGEEAAASTSSGDDASEEKPLRKPRKKRMSKIEKQALNHALSQQRLDQRCQLHIFAMSLFSIGQALKFVVCDPCTLP
jgi:hypothetical protein